jgi:hypothetical protein
MVASFLELMPIVSALIFVGLLAVSLLQFSAVRKNMRMQSEQQIYARIMDARVRLENSEAFTNMAKRAHSFRNASPRSAIPRNITPWLHSWICLNSCSVGTRQKLLIVRCGCDGCSLQYPRWQYWNSRKYGRRLSRFTHQILFHSSIRYNQRRWYR